MDTLISKRLVFHIGGYDPNMPPDTSFRRFEREIRRFEKTWAVRTSVSAPVVAADYASWDLVAKARNWFVETRFCLVRWDDIIGTVASRSTWQRIFEGQTAFFDFVLAGALWSYFRTNWRYALFFLYPFLMFDLFVLLALATAEFTARASGSFLLGLATASLMLVAFLLGPLRWLRLLMLFDDWSFASTYVRNGHPFLEQRLAVMARKIDAASRSSDVDEILIVGHSLGAVLAVDLLDQALKLNPSIGKKGPRVAFLSIGSSILKIGLHRNAQRFRDSLQRVAAAPGIFWSEYQALTDVMNFYKTNPVSELGLKTIGHPVVRIVKIRSMLEAVSYRRIRHNFYRVHSQFVSGNEKRAAYDYFMLVCGPLSAERHANLPDGAASVIDESGVLIETAPEIAPARKSGAADGR